MAKENSGCLSALFPFLNNSNDKKTAHQTAHKKAEDIYRLRDDFLSPAEYSFYKVTQDMMKNSFRICPKVSLSDLFFVSNPSDKYSAMNRINRKHVDFVICDPARMLPLFAIELDDQSHRSSNRRERDRFVDTVFAQAELPLVHIKAQHSYNQQELGIVFKQALFRSRNYQIILEQQKTQQGTEKSVLKNIAEKEIKTAEQGQAAPYCPKCGVQMVLREAKRGNNSGRQFYGCPNYPNCRMVIPIEDV